MLYSGACELNRPIPTFRAVVVRSTGSGWLATTATAVKGGFAGPYPTDLPLRDGLGVGPPGEQGSRNHTPAVDSQPLPRSWLLFC